jgi:hypothetical protein
MADIDHVLASIRAVEEIDAACEVLRATAPAAAAALGPDLARRLRATPIGPIPDLTEAEWLTLAEENQARYDHGGER